MIIKQLRALLFLMIAFTLFTGCAVKRGPYHPRLTSVSIIDRNGLSETISNRDRLDQIEKVNFISTQPYQKVMRVYSRMPNGDIKAYVTTYYENGQIRQYLELCNNRAFGKYNEWFENGQLKVDAQVIGGEGDVGTSHEKTWVFDSTCRAWDDEGKLEAEVTYYKGVLEGNTYYYHSNGEIWKCVPFDKGLIHGQERIYLANGELFQTNEYQYGVKSGLSTRYWCSEKIACQESYRSGKLDHGTYYDREGRKVSEIIDGEGYRALFGKEVLVELQEFHHGELDGEVKRFREDGSLYNSYHIKDEQKHGEEIEYYEQSRYRSTPLRKVSINWYQGSIQGRVKTWYPNGNQESQREFSKNIKNGLSTAWYEDGSLMMIEEYEKDGLVSGKYFKKGHKMPVSRVREGEGVATIFDSAGNYVKKIHYIRGEPSI